MYVYEGAFNVYHLHDGKKNIPPESKYHQVIIRNTTIIFLAVKDAWQPHL